MVTFQERFTEPIARQKYIEEGASIAELSKEFQVIEEAIKSRLRLFQLYELRFSKIYLERDLVLKKKPYEKLAEELGLSKAQLRKRIKAVDLDPDMNKRTNILTKEFLEKHLPKGKITYDRIKRLAIKLRFAPDTVYSRAEKYGMIGLDPSVFDKSKATIIPLAYEEAVHINP